MPTVLCRVSSSPDSFHVFTPTVSHNSNVPFNLSN